MSHAATANIGFPFIVGQLKDMTLISLSPLSNLNAELMERAAHQSPPLGIGAFLMGNNTVLALFNGAAHHTPVSALLLVTNAMINKKPGNS